MGTAPGALFAPLYIGSRAKTFMQRGVYEVHDSPKWAAPSLPKMVWLARRLPTPALNMVTRCVTLFATMDGEQNYPAHHSTIA